jgi:hypothetical protein
MAAGGIALSRLPLETADSVFNAYLIFWGWI